MTSPLSQGLEMFMVALAAFAGGLVIGFDWGRARYAKDVMLPRWQESLKAYQQIAEAVRRLCVSVSVSVKEHLEAIEPRNGQTQTQETAKGEEEAGVASQATCDRGERVQAQDGPGEEADGGRAGSV